MSTPQADGGEWGLTFLTRAAHATAPALLSGAHNLDTVDTEARSLFPSSLGPMRGPSVLGAYMLGHVARAARAQATTLLQHAWDDDQVRGHGHKKGRLGGGTREAGLKTQDKRGGGRPIRRSRSPYRWLALVESAGVSRSLASPC